MEQQQQQQQPSMSVVAPRSTVPSFVLVDVAAPLHECLRRLQAQVACVAATLDAEEQQRRRDGVRRSSATAAASGVVDDAPEGTADLRRRIAQKLCRLQAQHGVDLCSPSAVVDDVVNAGGVATAAVRESGGGGGAGRQSTRAAPPPPLTGDVWRVRDDSAVEEEDGEDIFGWVTQQPATPQPRPRPSEAAAQASAPVSHSGAVSRADEDVHIEERLRRVAGDLADVVECQRCHEAAVDDVRQHLRALQRYAEELLILHDDDRAAEALGTRLRRLLRYRPRHTIASADEQRVWQRAWVEAGCVAAPAPAVGTDVELIDVAVLARSNARRLEVVQRRWQSLRHDYVTHVEQLNRRLAVAALQLDEMESMRGST
ncbi:hypothetical protein NESM_000370900 [Novymonas esmeraldas]|uniref:Uncharacterized protein n=1 Tax=Novymonas esmeraldas TaxID=1808958 RepID=A0AAW0ELL0_9TRYP